MASIRSAPRALGAADRVVLRTVVYRGDRNEWFPFARTLRVGASGLAAPGLVIENLGFLRLIEIVFATSQVSTPDGLTNVFSSWIHELGGHTNFPAPSLDGFCVRFPSEQDRGGFPGWRVTLREPTNIYVANPPHGPFFDPRTNRFAATIGDAAADWMELPELRGEAIRPSTSIVTIIDPRATISGTVREESDIAVAIRVNHERELWFHASVTGYDDRVKSLSAVVRDRVARLSHANAFRAIEGYLLGADSFCYDHFAESDARPTTRGRTLFPILAQAGDLDNDIERVLINGESETVEVKDWMPLEAGEKKAIELLRTACAFANTRGGTLYVGVTRELELADTNSKVLRWSKNAPDLDGARNAYAAAMRARLADGITPSLEPIVRWRVYAGHCVFALHVPASPARPHHLIETNEAFVRRGANNKRASPRDILDMTASSPPEP